MSLLDWVHVALAQESQVSTLLLWTPVRVQDTFCSELPLPGTHVASFAFTYLPSHAVFFTLEPPLLSSLHSESG